MSPAPPALVTVIAPAHNEADNVDPLVEQIVRAMEAAGLTFEIIIVDDGSSDATPERLDDLAIREPRLRVVRMCDTPPGRGNGQSAAFHAGFRAARGEVIALLDADLQNDPVDIPRLVELMNESGADLVQGDRSQNRRDTAVKRVSSVIGRLFRRWLLQDSIRDTGCSLRVMRREVALQLPLQFRGMHRFIPVTARHLGFTVIETPVSHRPRVSGTTKYGTWSRAIPGLVDCFAVRWMRRRRRPVAFAESAPDRGAEAVATQVEEPARD